MGSLDLLETEAIEDNLTAELEEAVESGRERGNIDMTFWAYEANLQDSYFYGYSAGEERGIEIGASRGIEIGEACGRYEARSEGRKFMLEDLVRDGVLTAEDAAARLGISVDAFRMN